MHSLSSGSSPDLLLKDTNTNHEHATSPNGVEKVTHQGQGIEVVETERTRGLVSEAHNRANVAACLQDKLTSAVADFNPDRTVNSMSDKASVLRASLSNVWSTPEGEESFHNILPSGQLVSVSNGSKFTIFDPLNPLLKREVDLASLCKVDSKERLQLERVIGLTDQIIVATVSGAAQFVFVFLNGGSGNERAVVIDAQDPRHPDLIGKPNYLLSLVQNYGVGGPESTAHYGNKVSIGYKSGERYVTVMEENKTSFTLSKDALLSRRMIVCEGNLESLLIANFNKIHSFARKYSSDDFHGVKDTASSLVFGLFPISNGRFVNIAQHNWPVPANENTDLEVWMAAGSKPVSPDAPYEKPEKICSLRGHEAAIISVKERPDGILASASTDGTAKVWDYTQGEGKQCLATLTGHKDGVIDVDFLAGNRLITLSLDQTIKVWSLNSGKGEECLATISWPEKSLDRLIVREDGRILTASPYGTVSIWELHLPVALEPQPRAYI